MKMKFSLLIFSFIIFINHILGQTVPNDSLLLKTIYGYVDFNGETTTIEKPDEFKGGVWGDSLKFRIVFKEYIVLEGQELLLVISEAECFKSTGHYFGYRNKYFIKKNKTIFEIVKKFEIDEPWPIGDEPGIQVVRIGKTKCALKSQFSSTGNQHYERVITFSLITLDGFKDLINIQMDYSNEAWVIDEILENETCPNYSYMSSYQIINSDKSWFDINIEKVTYTYSKGCLAKEERKETKIYRYIDDEYKLIE